VCVCVLVCMFIEYVMCVTLEYPNIDLHHLSSCITLQINCITWGDTYDVLDLIREVQKEDAAALQEEEGEEGGGHGEDGATSLISPKSPSKRQTSIVVDGVTMVRLG
jgi:hypothetical protein